MGLVDYNGIGRCGESTPRSVDFYMDQFCACDICGGGVLENPAGTWGPPGTPATRCRTVMTDGFRVVPPAPWWTGTNYIYESDCSVDWITSSSWVDSCPAGFTAYDIGPFNPGYSITAANTITIGSCNWTQNIIDYGTADYPGQAIFTVEYICIQ